MSATNKPHGLAVKQIAVKDIEVGERIRKEQGDIKELAENIMAFGLMNPITVVETGNGGFFLVAGYRRLCAVRYLERDSITATVLPKLNGDDGFLMEISENEMRKNFTVSERLEYAFRLKEIEVTKAKKRMATHSAKENVGNPEGKNGRVRDIVAKMTGFSSGSTLDRAIFVANNRPDLLDKIDRDELSVMRAYQIARKDAGSDRDYRKDDAQEMVKFPPLFVPEEVKTDGIGIEGAGHEDLMRNPVYHTLYDRYMEMIQTVNKMVNQSEEIKRRHEAEIRSLKQQIKGSRSSTAQ